MSPRSGETANEDASVGSLLFTQLCAASFSASRKSVAPPDAISVLALSVSRRTAI
jgi:hypothetical protein